jgi:hypothetical protein
MKETRDRSSIGEAITQVVAQNVLMEAGIGLTWGGGYIRFRLSDSEPRRARLRQDNLDDLHWHEMSMSPVIYLHWSQASRPSFFPNG